MGAKNVMYELHIVSLCSQYSMNFTIVNVITDFFFVGGGGGGAGQGDELKLGHWLNIEATRSGNKKLKYSCMIKKGIGEDS